MNERMSVWVSEPANEGVSIEWVNEWMNEWMNEWTNERMSKC